MKTLNQFLNYLIAAVVIGFGAFYFLQFKKDNADRKVANALPTKPVNVDDVVNKYMKQTADQMVREQVNSQLAIRQQLSRPIVIKKEKTAEVNPEDIPADQQIWKDSRFKNSANEPKPVDPKVQEELAKKEFARQYIENARKDGYHVILSPDLKVLSVTPIRQPSQTNDSVESFPAD